MTRNIIHILFFLFCFYSAAAQSGDRIEGELIIQLYPGEDIDVLVNTTDLNEPGLEIIRPLSQRLNIWLVRYDNNENDPLHALMRNGSVANVQYNHTIQNRTIPNDNSYPSQWNMFNDGTGGGLEDADIDAEEAWNITTGGLTVNGDTIVVAVVDNGFDLAHEDLTYFKNYQEIPLNLIDDDENGYVDDYDGWNSIDDNGVIPEFNHGTHVSGIAGAIGNNTIGVAGVNWNLKILPVVCEVVEAQVIAAYAYVFELREQYDLSGGEKGAYIVASNSSFGIDFASPDDFPVWCAMYDSLGSLGILSAAATNNSLMNVDVVGDMPTGCTSDFLIAVTNTDKADNLKASYGAVSVDLGAPGTLIQSTFPGNTYGAQTGTSMASPHVAGTVALMFAAACENFLAEYVEEPEAMALLLKEYMLNGVDHVEDLNGVCVSSGRLNLYQSLQNLMNGYCSMDVPGIPKPVMQVELFPNPADNHIFIQTYPAAESLDIDIYNQTMQQVYAGQTINTTSELNITHFTNGIYFLKLANKKTGDVMTAAFVVQH